MLGTFLLPRKALKKCFSLYILEHETSLGLLRPDLGEERWHRMASTVSHAGVAFSILLVAKGMG